MSDREAMLSGPLTDDDLDYDIGTCQGCGSYGPLGSVCYRNGEECGERL